MPNQSGSARSDRSTAAGSWRPVSISMVTRRGCRKSYSSSGSVSDSCAGRCAAVTTATRMGDESRKVQVLTSPGRSTTMAIDPHHLTGLSVRSGGLTAAPPSRTPAIVLGVGLGALIYASVFFFLLQWHYMRSADVNPNTATGLEDNLRADGAFVLVAIIVVI